MSVICLSSVHILVSYQFSIFEKLPLLMEKQKKHQQLWLRVPKKFRTHGGTRTPNLRFRRPTPYPLGHAGTVKDVFSLWGIKKKKVASPGNRTRVARMGILHDTTTPATLQLLHLATNSDNLPKGGLVSAPTAWSKPDPL